MKQGLLEKVKAANCDEESERSGGSICWILGGGRRNGRPKERWGNT